MARLLTPRFLPKFQKQYKRLPSRLQKKFKKQLTYLIENPRHPSLNVKKVRGTTIYEARLDYHNRFIYKISGEEIRFYAIGPHDTGLGKK